MLIFSKDVRTFNSKELISLQMESTSKGNQEKWYCDNEKLYVKGQFYYQNKYWKDYLVEVIASKIAEQMDLGTTKVVMQRECRIIKNDNTIIQGVYSKDFCKKNERFIPILRLDREIQNKFYTAKSVEGKWNIILDVIQNITGLDYENYLVVMSLIDYLVGNEDRHLNNFGVLNKQGMFSEAPLFDFGLGLFEHDRRYEHVPFSKCLKLMQSKPFAADNSKVLKFIMKNYDIMNCLPKTIDLSDIALPSLKAGSYLLNRCKNLSIKLVGVE